MGRVVTAARAEPADGFRPSVAQQLRLWVAAGTQSVGGGPSTLYLMRSMLVRRGWLSDRQFMQEWTLSRISIGNHLTALAALIGDRVDGRRGVALALGGLLIPSAFITIALTGGFEFVRDDPAIVAALAGVGPVTIGMMLGITTILVRSVISPVLPGVILDGAVFVGAVVAGFLVPGATMAVIVAGAVLGVALMGREELPPEGLKE